MRVGLKSLVGVLAGLLLAGCGGDLNFTVRFDEVDGLRTGDRVLAATEAIGTVSGIEYTHQGDYRVAVHIERRQVDTLGRESVFFIDADPQHPGRRALMVLLAPAGSDLIGDGDTVEGTAKWSALLQRMTRRMEKVVAGIAGEIDRYWRELQDLPISEQAERLEAELDRILAELKRMSASAQHRLKTEILPRLRAQLEELRRKLTAPDHEEQLDRLEEKIERIDREMRV